jgi:hypothetical protein
MAGFMSTDLMELVRDMLVGDKEFHTKRFDKCVVEINEMVLLLKVFTYIPGYTRSEQSNFRSMFWTYLHPRIMSQKSWDLFWFRAKQENRFN